MFKKYCADKSIQIAKELFPNDYKNRKKYRTFHYAFGFIGRKLVGIGINQPNIPDAKALYFGRRFNVDQFIKFPFKHAEISLISRLWGKHHIDGDLSIYVVRLNSFGDEQLSKPCPHCQAVLDALGIDDVYWTPF